MTVENPAERGAQAMRHKFSFTGKASEYFGIWIVNLLLSIITLGIYTAWAKVRRLRYFYGNTWLDQHNFEYHAKPLQILIGRIVAVLLLVIFNVLAELFPIAALVLIIPYFLALPWLINKALQFNSRMTSYRNVRFGFTGSYMRALWVFVVLPLIVPLIAVAIGVGIVVLVADSGTDFDPQNLGMMIALGVLGVAFVIAMILLVPYISKQVNSYIANGLQFGTAEFEANIQLNPLFKNLGFAVLPVVIIGILSAIVFFVLVGVDAGPASAGIASVLVPIFYVSAIVAYFVYSAGVRNIAYNATRLGGAHQLKSTLPRYGYAWVLVSNLFVSVITIGLMIPWAAVRSWRYIADHTGMVSIVGLDQFTADQSEQGNVAAAEYLDIDGIDFGL